MPMELSLLERVFEIFIVEVNCNLVASFSVVIRRISFAIVVLELENMFCLLERREGSSGGSETSESAWSNH
jgi:hypothetical protein